MNLSGERRKINGEWVKALRKDLDLTQKELAESLGVSLPTVTRWEANAFRPTQLAARELLRFAEQARKHLSVFGPEASPSIEPHVPEVTHSQRRGTNVQAPSKPAKAPAPYPPLHGSRPSRLPSPPRIPTESAGGLCAVRREPSDSLPDGRTAGDPLSEDWR